MAYNEEFAERIRDIVIVAPGYSERKMFGGVGYMVFGNMACGVIRDYLIVRVGPDAYDDTLAEPNVRPFDMSGPPMRGWVAIAMEHLADDKTLQAWIDRGIAFAITLPKK